MKLDNIKPPEYKIYVDLDGVISDLTSYVEKLFGIKLTTQSDGNWAGDGPIWDKLHSMNEPQFAKLKMLPDAMTLWNYVKKYHPSILTASGQPVEKNSKDKIEWVKKHLTGYDRIIAVEKSEQKARYASPTSILIDDRTKSIRPWKQAGGIAIHHKNAADTIAKLKKLGL